MTLKRLFVPKSPKEKTIILFENQKREAHGRSYAYRRNKNKVSGNSYGQIINPKSMQLKTQFKWILWDRYFYVFRFCQVTVSFGSHLVNSFEVVMDINMSVIQLVSDLRLCKKNFIFVRILISSFIAWLKPKLFLFGSNHISMFLVIWPLILFTWSPAVLHPDHFSTTYLGSH